MVFGYQEIGYVCLEELLAFGVHVPCLFTHEDDPDEEIWFRRPITVAREHSIPIYTPDSLKDDTWCNIVKDCAPDYIFSFYYRYMIPRSILDAPRVAALNLHGSLLPAYRGRAPVNWVLVTGEDRTGVTLHEMVEKPDAGNIVAQKEVPITFEDDVYTLYMKMSAAARQLMKDTLPGLADETFARIPQTGPSSYFGGRKPEDGLISWQQNARVIYNLTRAVTHPYPGAFTYLGEKKLYIWKTRPIADNVDIAPGYVASADPLIVGTGGGALEILRIQVEGEKEMDGREFAARHQMKNITLGGNI